MTRAFGEVCWWGCSEGHEKGGSECEKQIKGHKKGGGGSLGEERMGVQVKIRIKERG